MLKREDSGVEATPARTSSSVLVMIVLMMARPITTRADDVRSDADAREVIFGSDVTMPCGRSRVVWKTLSIRAEQIVDQTRPGFFVQPFFGGELR